MNYHDSVTVNGALLRIAISEGRLWIRRSDLSKALKCSRGSVDFHLSRIDSEHQKNDTFKFMDEYAAKQVVFATKASGSSVVSKWLKSGGMSMPQTHESTSSTHSPNQMATVPKGGSSSYCENLVLAFLHHANKNEIKRFVQLVECEVAGILVRRPCKGLNDARHELYSRFYLQGGEK
ncbi:hypothetical protein [Pseudomonas aeruginosa]